MLTGHSEEQQLRVFNLLEIAVATFQASTCTDLVLGHLRLAESTTRVLDYDGLFDQGLRIYFLCDELTRILR